MNYTKLQLWERFQKYYTQYPELGLSLDISRMNFGDDFFSSLNPRMQKAFAAMTELERGAIANPDENRMVGHYWLRNPALAPTPAIRKEIEGTIREIKAFAKQIHEGHVKGAGGPFKNLLLIGIGGSALGPQFVSHALGNPSTDRLSIHFFDNTDPDGMDRVLARLKGQLGQTLCVVVSKSGGTKETRNGMLEAQAAYEAVNLNFDKHALTVTSPGSELDKHSSLWLKRFPMWDWVGGRTSELSAVGLLPAALQGFDIDALLLGARLCDERTRIANVNDNPAARLAAMWLHAGNGKGARNMVILPYKDRLELFSRYLQQLVMESLGKRLDLDGKVVNQGISVFGNKGSTDQHSYVQQLRDGLNNFFVVFIEVLQDRHALFRAVDPNVTSGDYLHGFLDGTRQALYDSDRQSVTITITSVTPITVGLLIALFERTVGLYASLVNVNAYNQPGVEAGKKAASTVIALQSAVLSYLSGTSSFSSAMDIATAIGHPDDVEVIFKICEHLAANVERGVKKIEGDSISNTKYGFQPQSNLQAYHAEVPAAKYVT